MLRRLSIQQKNILVLFDLVFCSKLRALFWIKVSKLVGSLDELSWWFDPMQPYTTNTISTSSWEPPPLGTTKLKVDGAASSDKAGCGGVLRKASRVIRVMFSYPIEAIGSEYVEIMAILTGLSLIGEANWDGQEALIKFQYIPREANNMTDFLAKSVMHRSSPFKA
ncbi:hypothetical protein GQ457_15G020320 [Hibiscus cannabinus]